jgi:hypothetical protein
MRPSKAAIAAITATAIGAAVLSFPAPARAATSSIEPTGAFSLFSISKSLNKNQAHYAIRLDPTCAPLGAAPVEVFWRMFEKGDSVIEPLTAREVASFGIHSQSVARRSEHGGTVHLLLNGFTDRPIDIETGALPGGGGCRATSTMPIAGKPALLFDVFAKIRWPFFVDYVLLSGWSLDGSHVVHEKMNPQ